MIFIKNRVNPMFLIVLFGLVQSGYTHARAMRRQGRDMVRQAAVSTATKRRRLSNRLIAAGMLADLISRKGIVRAATEATLATAVIGGTILWVNSCYK